MCCCRWGYAALAFFVPCDAVVLLALLTDCLRLFFAAAAADAAFFVVSALAERLLSVSGCALGLRALADARALVELLDACARLSCAAAAADAALLPVSAFAARARGLAGWLFGLLACAPRFRCETAREAVFALSAPALRFVRAEARALAALSRRLVALVSRLPATS